MSELPRADVDFVLDALAPHWRELHGRRLFLTGGTGFIGTWLTETFVAAVEREDLDATAVVLTRDATAFAARAPHVARHRSVALLEGDVRTFEFPRGELAFVIQAATDASARLNDERPIEMFDVIAGGTRRVLEFASAAGTRRLLLTSSGAVYGRQPPEIANVSEEYVGGPLSTDRRSAYGEGKRVAELLCAMTPSVECLIARCFAFVGPHLPLDRHFAIGNFIADAIAGRPIGVAGDGTPIRSYMYAADLAAWLWTILFRGQPMRPYNVGAERSLSIAETAEAVARAVTPSPPVHIAKTPDPARPAERYVPSTQRAQAELGLRETFTAEEAIACTVDWARGRGA